MLHRLLVAAIFACMALAQAPAAAQSSSPYGMSDPLLYADLVSRQVAHNGLAPLREVFLEFTDGAPLESSIESALITVERRVQDRDAQRWAKIEDIMLGDNIRFIFYYHVFDERTFLFTRYQFIRIDAETWTLATLSFGTTWTNVSIDATPGFRHVQ